MQSLGQMKGRVTTTARPGRGAVRVFSAIAGERQQKYQRPDITGRYGSFGGRYVPETLIPALDELEVEYKKALQDPAFQVCNFMSLLRRHGFDLHSLLPTHR